MKRGKDVAERLRFRRQFILGPHALEGFSGWSHLRIGRAAYLAAHPDLQAYQAQGSGKSITLLGYVLDPEMPESSNADIVNRLLARLEPNETPEAWIRRTYSFGGRWILIVDNGRDCWLFDDPCGYRQVFYTHGIPSGVWCGSQTGILAKALGLTMDPEAIDFIRAYKRREPEFYWPGDSSPFREVRHLLPNHYLDLRGGVAKRFWPDGPIAERSAADVARENAQLLQNIIASASHRAELALTVTAGKDTRLLLAASRALCHQVYYNTWMYWDMTPASRDIRVPSRLLAHLGLPHHVIPCPARMNREFGAALRDNVPIAHDSIGVIAQGLHDNFPQQKLQMMGDGMPIADWGLFFREKLRKRTPQSKGDGISSETLAWLTGREDEFAMRAFDRWLSGARNTEVDVLDLFGWEDCESNFVGMTQAELDVAHDVLVPYDCRRFLVNMLSAPRASRAYPDFALHRLMILQLWPDVLAEPVNPRAKPTLSSMARALLLSPRGRRWKRLWMELHRYRKAA